MAFIFDIAEEYRLQEEYDRHSILELLVHRLIDLLAVTVLLEFAGPGANLVYIFAGGALHGLFQRHARVIDTVMAILLAGCAVYLLIA